MAKEWNSRRTAAHSSPEARDDFEAWKKDRAELLKSITSVSVMIAYRFSFR
jgi:hypothetical protein